jgi:hypothetical protein
MGALTAWYRVAGSGVEQGFTLPRRPSRGATLAVSLSTAGLRATLVGPDRAVLRGPSGGVLTYGGLSATDARGRRLATGLTTGGNGLVVTVDVRRATFPVVIDPWVEVMPPLAQGPIPFKFGSAVAVDGAGTTALVGDPSGDPHNGIGTVAVYSLADGVWGQTATFNRPHGAGAFGTSVALDAAGDEALVGDPSGGAAGHGVAEVYTLSGGSWSANATLLQVPGVAKSLGSAVALSADGKTALVGDPTGGTLGTGYLAVYTLTGATWSAAHLLPAPSGSASFGSSVALSADGNTALGGDPAAGGQGSATTYTRTGATWGPPVSLPTPIGATTFGTAVAVASDGLTAVVGDPNAAPGVVTVFTRPSGGAWSVLTTLPPPPGAAFFGDALAVSGVSGSVLAAVGDPAGNGGTTGAATTYLEQSGAFQAGENVPPPAQSLTFGAAVAVATPASQSAWVTLVGDPNGASGGAATAYAYSTVPVTVTAVSAPTTNAVVGQPVAVTATVTVAPPGSGAPTDGTVLFQDTFGGSTAPAPCLEGADQVLPASGSGQVTCTVSYSTASARAHTISASYSSIANPVDFAPSSGSTMLTVHLATSQTSLTAAPAGTSSPGEVTTFTAVVTPVAPSTGLPFGTVSFTDDTTGAPLCLGVTLVTVGGQQTARCATTFTALTPGDRITAAYTPQNPPGYTASSASVVQAVQPPPPPPGYWMTTSAGQVLNFGQVAWYGSTIFVPLAAPIVGMAGTPDANGYWLVAGDGGVFTFGDAGFFGSAGALTLSAPIVGMARTLDGQGYWLVAADGGVFAYGDAGFYGSAGNLAVNQPIVGMAATPDGRGYWLVAADGGLFAYGDAPFYGSTGGLALNQPIVGMATTPDGGGYWLVAADGGIFAYGDAGFYGSTGGLALNQPIVGMQASGDGRGYLLVAADGGIFAFGDATFSGSAGGQPLDGRVVGMT